MKQRREGVGEGDRRRERGGKRERWEQERVCVCVRE